MAWSLEQGGSYHPSPLVYGDHYYTLLDRGLMTSHDARTGAEVYGRQRIDVGQAFTASPWAYNGKVFALSEQGTTYVIEAGPEFRILAENPLDEFTMATPAILDDSLIIRTAEGRLPHRGAVGGRVPHAESRSPRGSRRVLLARSSRSSGFNTPGTRLTPGLRKLNEE